MRRRSLVAAFVLLAVPVIVIVLLCRGGKGKTQPPTESRPDRTAPWRLVVEVRDDSGDPTYASVFLTNEAGDLVERIDGEPGEEVSFDATGVVGLRVVGRVGLAPALFEGLAAPAGTVKRLAVTLQRGLPIRGQIVEASGNLQLRDSLVHAEPVDAPWNTARGESWEADSGGDGRWLIFEALVDEDGGFELKGLLPGRYRLTYGALKDEYDVRDEAQVVEAGANGIEIHVVPAARVKLRFLDIATHEPPTSGSSYELTSENGDSWSGGTDAEDARFWMRPGTKGTLLVEAEGYLPHEPVSIVAGGSGEETEIVCEFHPDPGVWAYLVVWLKDENGQPVTDMTVDRGWRTAVGDDKGRYQLRLPTGSWRIHAWPNWALLHDLRTFRLPLSEEVRLERGQHVRRDWTVQRGGLIAVRGDIEREPWLTVDGKRMEDVCWAEPPKGTDSEDAPKYVALVAAGSYTVETRCGGRRVSAAVEVHVGEVTTVMFPAAR